jgi:tight adherence protein C
MIAELTLAFFALMLSMVAGAAYWVWSREEAAALADGPAPAPKGAATEETLPEDLPAWLRLLATLGTGTPKPAEERASLRRDLASAGIRDDWAVPVVFGAQLFLAALVPVVLLALFFAFSSDIWTALAPAAIGGYIGYRFPRQYVNRLIERRKKKIQQGLPDLLDLLVVSVDSGLSLDHALADTARDLAIVHPVLSEELAVFQVEVRAGTSRSEALRNLALRTREPDMKKLTSLLIQADRFGTSVGKVLRTQAHYMRVRRRQRAEEIAHKVGVKLIFPIFLLIMPSVFVVTAGPAVLQLFLSFRNFSSGF